MICALLQKMNKQILAKILIFTALISGTFAGAAKIAQASSATDVWWPVSGEKLSGSHPFKALVQNTDIKNYTMYWQVDGGQLNKMDDSYTDYPHKEAQIDFSGWTWKGNDTYEITFVSKDQNGSTISEKKVSIYANYKETSKEDTRPAPAEAGTGEIIATTPAPAPEQVQEIVIEKEETVATDTIQAPTEVWWPAQHVNITGPQPFKAVLKDVDLSKYKMYWQVDGKSLTLMPDNYNDYPHKEVMADVNWNWKGQGPYVVTFIAKDLKGNEISRKDVTIYNPNGVLPKIESSPAPAPTPVVTAPQPEIAPATPVSSNNPFAGLKFYVNPDSNAKRQAEEWKTTRPTDAKLMEKIAANPDSKWVGNWNSNIQADVKEYVDVATANGGMPVLIAYNIPGRDCGHYSAGGAANAQNYKTWIRGLADGIGSRKAAVILEPDALAGITCLDSAGQESRYELIKDAIQVLQAKGNVAVYVDAGHSNWIGVEDMAARLKKAGIENAHGFALNVSNYNRTEDQLTYGTKLSGLLNGKHFVVDTSRNGQGPLGSEWCNPSGRGLGKPATTNTGNPLVDAYMWLKNPGESDGTCNGGPSAGVWWPEYALGLAQRAEF